MVIDKINLIRKIYLTVAQLGEMYINLQQARTFIYWIRGRDRREDSFVDNDRFYITFLLNSWEILSPC